VLDMLDGSVVNTMTRHNDGDFAGTIGVRIFGCILITTCFALLAVIVQRIADGQDALYGAAVSASSS